MNLIGKTEHKFKEWFNYKYNKEGIKYSHDCPCLTSGSNLIFQGFSDSMKWGVYQDFFKDNGIYVFIIPYEHAPPPAYTIELKVGTATITPCVWQSDLVKIRKIAIDEASYRLTHKNK